jgi:serine protease
MKIGRIITLGAAFLMGAFFLTGAAQNWNFKSFNRQFRGSPFISDEIVVQFNPDMGKSDIHKLAAKLGLSLKKHLSFGPYAVFKLRGQRPESALPSVRQEPGVVAADQNSVLSKAMIPNDPFYAYQWHLEKINLPAAWDDLAANHGEGAVVAVIDTGVAYEDYDIYLRAPDLANTRFITGYDFVNDDTHANDDEGHGTHVCGTLAQSTNNGYGAAGVASKATIMPLKILDQNGSGTADGLIDALHFAADNGCDVANMSLAWPPGYDPGETVHNAVKYAYNKGVVMVGASGNEGNSSVSYPAAYPEVISVGATNSADEKSDYSNYGAALEVCAPGGDGVDRNGDTYPDGVLQQTFGVDPTDFGFWFYMGTSSAAPHGAARPPLSQQSRRCRNSGYPSPTSMDLGSNGWDTLTLRQDRCPAALDTITPPSAKG